MQTDESRTDVLRADQYEPVERVPMPDGGMGRADGWLEGRPIRAGGARTDVLRADQYEPVERAPMPDERFVFAGSTEVDGRLHWGGVPLLAPLPKPLPSLAFCTPIGTQVILWLRRPALAAAIGCCFARGRLATIVA